MSPIASVGATGLRPIICKEGLKDQDMQLLTHWPFSLLEKYIDV
jgi:hypothetical protein